MGKVAPIKIGQRMVGQGHPVFVIAEVGINHEGDFGASVELVHAAHEAGADAVKLQTISPDANYHSDCESYAVFSGAELSRDETADIFALIRKLDMEPMTTVGDFETLDWLQNVGPSAYKISSGLLTNTPLIKKVAGLHKPLIMSTGMSDDRDISVALNIAHEEKARDIVLLQCTSRYPAPIDSLNLSVIRAMQDKYNVHAGFSDHSLGIGAAILSVGAGAVVIEKHFTQDPSRQGYDHHLSLDPQGFGEMVRGIRNAEKMMGSTFKTIDPELTIVRDKFLRCVMAARDIRGGETFSLENLALKRPLPENRGLPPSEFDALLGQVAARDILRDSPITKDDLRY